MDKKTRLRLIKKAYQDSRKTKRKLTPKAWQLIKEIREENEEVDPDVVVDFSQDDIREEIQLMSGLRRANDVEVDWDNGRYYDTNTSAEMLYFRRELD
jgi:hypothetical protein